MHAAQVFSHFRVILELPLLADKRRWEIDPKLPLGRTQSSRSIDQCGKTVPRKEQFAKIAALRGVAKRRRRNGWRRCVGIRTANGEHANRDDFSFALAPNWECEPLTIGSSCIPRPESLESTAQSRATISQSPIAMGCTPTCNGIDVPKWKYHRPLEGREAST
jgi:hypothetical protein